MSAESAEGRSLGKLGGGFNDGARFTQVYKRGRMEPWSFATRTDSGFSLTELV